MRRRLQSLALAVVIHATLLGWLCWPLPQHLATHLPHPNLPWDRLFIGWALSHQSRALVSDPCAYADANIYYPDRHTLFYGEAGFGAMPLFMPVFLLTGNPTLALNCVLLLGVLATACALHVVVERWTGSFGSGVVAGATFLVTPWVLRGGIVAAPNYAVLPYLPFILFVAARPDPGRAVAATLAALLALQGLTSVYVALATLVPLGVLALARSARPATRRAGLSLVAALVTASALLAIAYSGYAMVRAQNPTWGLQTAWPLPGSTAMALEQVIGMQSATGIPRAVLALIAVGALLRWWFRNAPASPREIWVHGLFWTIVATVISLRPAFTWHGQRYGLPAELVALLAPFWEIVRFPERLAIGGLIGLAVLAGAAAAEALACFGRVHRWLRPDTYAGRLVSAVAIAWLIMHALPTAHGGTPLFGWNQRGRTGPYPLIVPPGPQSPLMPLLSEPGGPLLELPIEGTEAQAQAQYRSIFHRRALVNGYSGYWPAGFPARKRLALRLPDPDALADLRSLTELELILVNTRTLPQAKRQPWLALAGDATDRNDLRLIARDGDLLLFHVENPPPG